MVLSVFDEVEIYYHPHYFRWTKSRGEIFIEIPNTLNCYTSLIFYIHTKHTFLTL